MSIKNNVTRILSTLPSNVKYVVVSKFRPLEQLQEAYGAGMRIFAESRPAELAAKAAALPSDIHWHFIGHLQTNKLKMVLPYAELIHSADSLRLLEAIERYCCAQAMNNVNVLMEIHVAAEESKQGFSPEEAISFFENSDFRNYTHISFCGLMGMATNTDDSARIEADFATMNSLFQRIKNMDNCPESFRELSIGMSDDYLLALKHGSTMVRIGSASFE